MFVGIRLTSFDSGREILNNDVSYGYEGKNQRIEYFSGHMEIYNYIHITFLKMYNT